MVPTRPLRPSSTRSPAGGGGGGYITETTCWSHNGKKYKVTIKYKKAAKAGGGKKWKIKKGYPKASIKKASTLVPSESSSNVDSSVGNPTTGMDVIITTTFTKVPSADPVDSSFDYSDNIVLWGDGYGSAPSSTRIDPADYTATILSVDSSVLASGEMEYEVTYRVVLDGLGSGHPDQIVSVLQATAFPVGGDAFPVAIEPTTMFDADD